MTARRLLDRRLPAVLAGAILLLAASAPAQPDNPPAADALFRAGREAMAAGRVAEACGKFRESHRLEPAPGTQLNLALCEEKLGHLTVAWGLFKRALRELGPDDERVAVAREGVERIDRRLARLTVRIDSQTPAGAQVLLDGKVLTQASFDTPLPVDPGTKVLVLRVPRHADRQQSVLLEPGSDAEVTLQAGPALAEGQREPPRNAPAAAEQRQQVDAAQPLDSARDLEPGRGGSATAGWVVAGLGAASVAVGTVTGLMVLSKKRTVDRHCGSDGLCDQTGLDAARSGNTLATVSTVTYLVGLAGVGAGLYLVVSSDNEAGPASAIGPALLSDGAGVHLWARF